VAAARAALFRRLPWPAEDVAVRLAQPVNLPAALTADADDVRISAEPHAGVVTAGRVQMDVEVSVGGERKLSQAVYLEVRPLVTVAVCKRPVEKGEALTDADVVIERRPADPGQQFVGAVSGKRARRPLQA